MKIEAIRETIKNFREGIPGLVSIMLFDRERNLILYEETDDITSPPGEIFSCYANLVNSLEKAHACRKNTIGKSIKCLHITSDKMTVSLRTLSEKHMIVGEFMGQKGLWLFAAKALSLAKTLMEARNE